MKSNRSVCLRDIAEVAGVTRMTVSKALRGVPGVSEENRRRIKKIAQELGYKPNPNVAKALAAVAETGHSSVGERLAFLTTHKTAEGWRDFPHITGCFEGAKERAKEIGYELESFWALEPGIKLADVLYARGIDGIVLAPTGAELMSEGRRTIDFDWSRASVVEINEQLDDPHFRVVRHDHYSSMLESLYQLESLGYRRIGFAMSRTTEARNRHRWSSAYLLWSRMRNAEGEIPLYLYDDDDVSAFGQWARANRLDSIIGLPREFLMMKKAGLECPKELGFASLDHQAVPGEDIVCSGVDQNSHSIGASAVDLLVGLIHTGEKGPPPNPVKLVCAGRWVSGESTMKVGEPLEDRSLYEAALTF
ncbi:LacI family DNA-binding transcriptional regulator [Pelagicoccus mobilis]|uniref:LacI family DNA-binding transcriptional regulator n=1 Tax=Pelagicoccus mobilis TaxID=415221 RepID=A0A934RVB6_9BACT|nr:LacI family DNA-binding transcriptional regulator [Pelagicoccus mobilis]MBK1876105.1 LacI family DNA-binding transcriptional regulator [Pelagicoccus mobilis]